VAVVNDIIIGWASLSAWSDRRAYARTAEVSLYVEKGHRRRGSGRALLGDLITCARNAGLAVLIARIAEGNQVSLKLFQSMGFHRIGTMRRVGEKFGRVLDVELLDMQLEA
jgi:phosphinothricin acetyltransferase